MLSGARLSPPASLPMSSTWAQSPRNRLGCPRSETSSEQQAAGAPSALRDLLAHPVLLAPQEQQEQLEQRVLRGRQERLVLLARLGRQVLPPCGSRRPQPDRQTP